MQKLKEYSKLWAALASLVAGLVATHFADVDSAMLEAGILLALAGLGVYAAPRNAEKPE